MKSAYGRFCCFAFALLCLCNMAFAEEAAIAVRDNADQKPIDYCRVFGSKAAEARQARQVEDLLKMKTGIEQQLLILDEKTKVLSEWLDKRSKIRERVSESLVKIYSNVDAEVAAQHLQKLDVDTASEVLQRLNPKVSGEIMSAMEVKFASALVALMVNDAGKLARKAEAP